MRKKVKRYINTISKLSNEDGSPSKSRSGHLSPKKDSGWAKSRSNAVEGKTAKWVKRETNSGEFIIKYCVKSNSENSQIPKTLNPKPPKNK